MRAFVMTAIVVVGLGWGPTLAQVPPITLPCIPILPVTCGESAPPSSPPSSTPPPSAPATPSLPSPPTPVVTEPIYTG